MERVGCRAEWPEEDAGAESEILSTLPTNGCAWKRLISKKQLAELSQEVAFRAFEAIGNFCVTMTGRVPRMPSVEGPWGLPLGHGGEKRVDSLLYMTASIQPFATLLCIATKKKHSAAFSCKSRVRQSSEFHHMMTYDYISLHELLTMPYDSDPI